ncbi:hypothetical protein CEXT_547471 [Caerostris extrusa]|uniref:Uncharacterized protein n=1 Tax=Caerostris extrusa TaxID=172846 RepID=A0AAV4UG24_CAEEX|nr:hypothetical protein CEXT_547471 [Caerostris extrusa]
MSRLINSYHCLPLDAEQSCSKIAVLRNILAPEETPTKLLLFASSYLFRYQKRSESLLALHTPLSAFRGKDRISLEEPGCYPNFLESTKDHLNPEEFRKSEMSEPE